MFVELPRVRLDGGARAFRQHWGYESRPLAPPPPLIEEDEAAVEPETVSLREANTASPIGERVLVDLSVTSKTIYSVIVVSSFVGKIDHFLSYFYFLNFILSFESFITLLVLSPNSLVIFFFHRLEFFRQCLLFLFNRFSR